MIGIKPVEAFVDSVGVMHPTKEAALAAELERALGRIGTGDATMTPGIVKKLIENRDIIGELLRAFGPLEVAGPALDAA